MAMGRHSIEFAYKRPPYWNSTSGFDFFDHITAVDMSLCTSLRNFIQIGPKMVSCPRWRISAILDFRDPMMGSLKSPIIYKYCEEADLNSGWVFLNVLNVYASTRYSNRYSDSYPMTSPMTSSEIPITQPPTRGP